MINFQKEIEKTEKGCGIVYGEDLDLYCVGDEEADKNTFKLCPTCQAKLQTLKNCRDGVKDAVNNYIKVNLEFIDEAKKDKDKILLHQCYTVDYILERLRNELGLSEEETLRK